MVDTEAKAQLAKARDAGSALSLVVEWSRQPDLSRLATIGSKRERMRCLKEACEQVKAPLVKALASEADVEVRDLEGSTQAIVTAKVSKWRQLAGNDGLLGKTPDATVLPDVRFEAF